jgi:hypothetical protein
MSSLENLVELLVIGTAKYIKKICYIFSIVKIPDLTGALHFINIQL